MSDCFVSYKREDRPRVESLVGALRAAGITVWWDQDIGGGARWRESIVEQLDAARCVVVCWTQASTAPAGLYVREEAERARQRGVLLPVLFEPVAPPFGFGEVQALDLTEWRGNVDDARWLHFLATLRAVADGQQRPPRPLLPRVPGHRWRLAALGGVALLFALLLGGAGGTSALCGDGTLREACRALGLGGVPSRDDESAWAAARHAVQETGSGEGYRRYLREQPAGSFAALAQAGLAACTEVAEVRWQRRDDPLPLVVNAGSSPAPDETAARANSAAEVQRQADALCASYGKSPAYRLLGAAPEAPGWRCRESRRGWTCAFDGRAVCQLEVRSTVAREHCV